MFKETQKFFGPQVTPDLSSGINVPDGLVITPQTSLNFSVPYLIVGETIQDPDNLSKPFPLFLNPLDIQTDAQNAKTPAQVSVIAARSTMNNQQLNRCEQPLPFEPNLFSAAFRRAVSGTTEVSDAITACVNEVNKIYIPILLDSNRRIFELNGISSRRFPNGLYTYEEDVKLSPKKGILYATSVNDETLQPITAQPVGICTGAFLVGGTIVVLFSDSTIRYYTRYLEQAPIAINPTLVTKVSLTPANYQGIVQRTDIPFGRVFVCKVDDLKITEVSVNEVGVPPGTIISNVDIDTVSHNNFPIIGIVNLKPQILCPDLFSSTLSLLIAEQEANTIVSMKQGGGVLQGWTFVPQPIRGISENTVSNDFGQTNSDKTIAYEDPDDSENTLACRIKLSENTNSSCFIQPITGGIWEFHQNEVPPGPVVRTFTVGVNGLATYFTTGAPPFGFTETRTAILWNTAFLNDSRIDVLKVRLAWQDTTFIPFSRDTVSGALTPCTCEIYQFTTATPGVVVNGDLETGVGTLLSSFVIPYSDTGATGASHPPPDPDGVVRGGWAFDMPVSALNNASGYTGIFVRLVGFPPPSHAGALYLINAGVPTPMKLLMTLNSDISSTTPTTFLSLFPPDGTGRYEERRFFSYILDKQQEFVVPVKNIKQLSSEKSRFVSSGFSATPKVRALNVEFPRLCYVRNSVAKTQNGSTYVTNSFSSPFLTSGRALKVGEFFESRSGSTVTTKTRRLILTFDRSNYWYQSMRIVDGLCKLQMHIQSYTSRSINDTGEISVINNPNKFSLLAFISGTNPENGIKVINGGTVFKSIDRDMSLDLDNNGIVTESELGRDYIVEFDVTTFMNSLRKTSFSSYGFIFRNENERQFFDLATADTTISGGEISSTVEIFDELAPRLLFTDNVGYLFNKNGYRSASLPPLVPKVIVS